MRLPVREALDRRLGALSPWYAHYGWAKVRLDPVYGLVLSELGPEVRTVVDLGAGMGLFEALLLHGRSDVSVVAVERDARKARVARRLLEGMPSARVVEEDARTVDLGNPDAVLLLDLLHYLTEEDQLALLSRCASCLSPGGTLLIRELCGGGLRGTVTRAMEGVAVRLGWNRAARVHPLPVDLLTSRLEETGLILSARPAGRGPFAGNVLLVARKPA